MVASDEGQLKEARELLRRAVAVDPTFANGQVALGVAALLDQDQAEARQALERAAHHGRRPGGRGRTVPAGPGGGTE
jgi:Tfp pilus assembly protein PilF